MRAKPPKGGFALIFGLVIAFKKTKQKSITFFLNVECGNEYLRIRFTSEKTIENFRWLSNESPIFAEMGAVPNILPPSSIQVLGFQCFGGGCRTKSNHIIPPSSSKNSNSAPNQKPVTVIDGKKQPSKFWRRMWTKSNHIISPSSSKNSTPPRIRRSAQFYQQYCSHQNFGGGCRMKLTHIISPSSSKKSNPASNQKIRPVMKAIKQPTKFWRKMADEIDDSYISILLPKLKPRTEPEDQPR